MAMSVTAAMNAKKRIGKLESKWKKKNNKKIQTGVEIFVVTVVWQFGQRTTVLLLTEYRRILLLC